MIATKRALLLLLPAMLMTACGGDSAPGDGDGAPDVTYRELQLNASSHTDYVYLNLDTGELIDLDAAGAAVSVDWHMAFRRFAIQLNGGASGPGDVAGAVAASQGHFYLDNGDPAVSVFTNATPASELAVFSDDLPVPTSWISDAVVTPLRGTSSTDGGWYLYNLGTGVISANPANGWLLRSGEGNSYARVRATEITFNTRAGQGVESFTFEFDVQVPDTDQFSTSATFSGSLPAGGGELCFDFDADDQVACSGTAWDLKIGYVGRSFFLRTNGGVSGAGSAGAFGPMAWSELSTWTSATITPEGASVASHYQEDITSGVFSQQEWYAYNLTGMHRLWPNYRVYVIDTDRQDDSASRYAVQITGYYAATGASGHPRLRWRRIN